MDVEDSQPDFQITEEDESDLQSNHRFRKNNVCVISSKNQTNLESKNFGSDKRKADGFEKLFPLNVQPLFHFMKKDGQQP